MPKKYNHMFDVAFALDSDLTPEQLNTPEGSKELLEALEARLNQSKQNPSECADAFGHCDTYLN